MTKVWIADVNRKDGRKLVSFWNSTLTGTYFIEKNRFGKLYSVIKQF